MGIKVEIDRGKGVKIRLPIGTKWRCKYGQKFIIVDREIEFISLNKERKTYFQEIE